MRLNKSYTALKIMWTLFAIALVVSVQGKPRSDMWKEFLSKPLIDEHSFKPIPQAPPSSWPKKIKLIKKRIYLQPQPTVVKRRLLSQVTHSDYHEPLKIRIKKMDAYRILRQLAKDSVLEKIKSQRRPMSFLRAFEDSLVSRIDEGRLQLTSDDLKWLNLKKLSHLLRRKSVKAYFSTRNLWQLKKRGSQLTRDFLNHFPDEKLAVAFTRRVLRKSLQKKTDKLNIEVLLPKRITSLLGQYSYLRGRNCFATALSFWEPQVIRNKAINVIEEPKHFKAMINSDEFQRALRLGYIQLSEEEVDSGLKYGDMVVFYDKTQRFSYRYFKHAAIHLAGNIYFHKPSKSPSTPLEITDWKSMAVVWRKYTDQLGYKAFRKIPELKNYPQPHLAIEKIPWSH